MIPETILDTTRHEYDPASILEWALGVWEINTSLDLMVITVDAAALDNRLRVKLSTERRRLKHSAAIRQFAIESKIIDWQTARGRFQALCLTYKIHGRHIVNSAFDMSTLRDNKS